MGRKLGRGPMCGDRRRWYRTFAAVPRGKSQYTYCVRESGHKGSHRDVHDRGWEST